MKHLSRKTLFIIGGVFALLAIAFTFVVKSIDVRTVGTSPESVGLAGVNETVRNLFPYGENGINDMLYKITKYAGYAVFLPAVFFAILGVVELFKRKSFKKVDRELKILALFYIVVGAFYFAFDHFLIINYAPVLREGVLKPSYPSSHVLFAITFCGSAMIVNNALLKKNRKQARFMNALLSVLMLVVVVGRLLSGVHWFTDIIGGVLISFALVTLFSALIHGKSSKKESTEKESEE